MLITKRSIQEVRERADVVSVISDVVQLTKKGSSFQGLCPFHNEKTPSFHVRADKNYYHCFGCGVSGDALGFIMDTQGLSFPDAIEYLASKFGIKIEYEKKKDVLYEKPKVDRNRLFEINNIAMQFYLENLKLKIKNDSVLKNYLIDRGLNGKAIIRFNLGFAPDSWDSLTRFLLSKNYTELELLNSGLSRKSSKGNLIDLMRNRLIFPIMQDKERVVAFGGRVIPAFSKKDEPKYINSPETPIYYKQKVLYGLSESYSEIRKEKFVYITEGYMDVISLQINGVLNSIATCGTALTSQHAVKLKHLTDKVVVIFDGDSAGRKAAARSFEVFLNSGIDVRVIFLAEGEDPDSYAKKHGLKTSDALSKFTKHSAMSCYVRSLLLDYGFNSLTDITPVVKGKIADSAIKLISKVNNTIEKKEYEKELESLLNINTASLRNQIRIINSNKPLVRDDFIGEKNSLDDFSDFNSLKNYEQELLYLLMYLKGSSANLIKDNPIFCQHLSSEALRFCIELGSLNSQFSANQEEFKKEVKLYLEDLGSSWINAWHKAHKIYQNKKPDAGKTINEFKQRLERENVLALLDFARIQMLETKSEAEQAEISIKIIGLSKKLAEMKPIENKL